MIQRLRSLFISIVLLVAGLLLSQAATASPFSEFINQYDDMMEIDRALTSRELCKALFREWPQPTYKGWLQDAGSLYAQKPKAAQYLLNLCNSMWTLEILGPKRAEALRLEINKNLGQYALSLMTTGLLEGHQCLPEQIRLFRQAVPKIGGDGPPAPFEVLSNLASSQRTLDASILSENRARTAALASLSATAVAVVADWRLAKSAAQAAQTAGLSAGRVVKQALILTILGIAVERAVDYEIKKTQTEDYVKQVEDVVTQLEVKGASPALLHEFYSRVENLGFFYTKAVELPEGRRTICKAALIKASQQTEIQASPRFARETCQDPTLIWLAASSYIKSKFAEDAVALSFADKLAVKAAYSYLSYEAAKAAALSKPVCKPNGLGNPFLGQMEMECLDPVTKRPVI